MDTLATTLLTTVITKLTTVLSIADKIDGIDEAHQQIVYKIKSAICSLEKSITTIQKLT